MKPKIIVIVGPTAVGKTALGVYLAKKYNGEVINGDSLQFYKQLDIGTAKVTADEMDGVSHHLLDILSYEEPFTASDFKREAERTVQSILQRGKIPILVGGSGLYIQGLIQDLSFGHTGEDKAYRTKLEERLLDEGGQVLWEELQHVDSKAADAIHPNNPRRVIRALESIHATGELFSKQQIEETSTFDALLIALSMDRSALYERINQRVDQMVESGLEKEARWLYEAPFGKEAQAAKGIGYKEWFPYFEGQMPKEEMIETLKQNSRRYAKRQLTWFRNRMNPMWFDPTEPDFYEHIDATVQTFIADR